MTTTERNWIVAAVYCGGNFVSSFAGTCIAADEDNFKILQPILQVMMTKYPQYLNQEFQEKAWGIYEEGVNK